MKEVKPHFILVVEDGIALETIQGNWASSCIEGNSGDSGIILH